MFYFHIDFKSILPHSLKNKTYNINCKLIIIIYLLNKKWMNRGSNPGPTACKAGVIPLHHTPSIKYLDNLLI